MCSRARLRLRTAAQRAAAGACGSSQAAGRATGWVRLANPTGPLVIVNARAAAVGDALVRIFRAQGYTVESQYYVNDAGNQFMALARSVDARLRQALGEAAELPENAYPGDTWWSSRRVACARS
jgi:hypothetical protein